MGNYKVSVIIPTYNRAEFLGQAIESALAQDYPNIEIIVIDNASTDNTQNIVNSYIEDARIKYFINPENIGMVNNWKKALYEYVTGEWFIILSDDDYLINSTYLTRAIHLAKEDNQILLIYAGGILLDMRDNSKTKLEQPFNRINCGKDIFMTRNQVKPIDFILCNVLFKVEASKRLDCFNAPNNLCCDSQLFLQLCLRGKVGYLNEEVAVYRMHTSNLTHKILTHYPLFIESWSYLSIPFNDAKENQLLDSKQIGLFENKQIYQEIYKVLLNSVLFFPEKRFEISQKLIQEFNQNIFNLVSKNKFLKVKIFLALFCPKVYLQLQRLKNKRLK